MRKGTKHTKDTLEKMSKSHKGIKFSNDRRKNISIALTGRQLSIETKNKIGKANKGHITSENTKRKIGDALRGRPLLDKVKENLRKIASGRKLSDQWRKNISKSAKGRVHSEETKHKMRKSHAGQIPWNKGKSMSSECKRKHRTIRLNKVTPATGSNENFLLDGQEIKDNCKIDRNFSVIGYKPDGYCHETNTIYEVYERFHDKQIFEDLERENIICNRLGCDFIIIHDRTH